MSFSYLLNGTTYSSTGNGALPAGATLTSGAPDTAAQIKTNIASNAGSTPSANSPAGTLYANGMKAIPNANITTAQTAQAISQGWSAQPIPASSVTAPAAAPIVLPTKTQTPIPASATAPVPIAGSTYNAATQQYIANPTTAPTSTSLTDQQASDARYAKFKSEILSQVPQAPSQEAAYKQAEAEAGTQALKEKVNDYTTQLNNITSKQQADLLQLRGSGAANGVTEAVYGGQQAEINREAAIQSLPVQAQLAAAQGNLTLAQAKLDTLFKIKLTDAQNQYQYKKDQYNAISSFLTKEEDIKLNKEEKANDRAYSETQDFLKNQQQTYMEALAAKAPQSILNNILSSKNTTEMIKNAGAYGISTDIRYKQASIEALTVKSNPGNEAITLDEAAKYGLPVGTTYNQLRGKTLGGNGTILDNPDVIKQNAQDFQAVYSAKQTLDSLAKKVGKASSDDLTIEDVRKLDSADQVTAGKAVALMANPSSPRLGQDAGNVLDSSSFVKKLGTMVFREVPNWGGINPVYNKQYDPVEVFNAIQTGNSLYSGRLSDFQQKAPSVPAIDETKAQTTLQNYYNSNPNKKTEMDSRVQLMEGSLGRPITNSEFLQAYPEYLK